MSLQYHDVLVEHGLTHEEARFVLDLRRMRSLEVSPFGSLLLPVERRLVKAAEALLRSKREEHAEALLKELEAAQ